MTARGRSGSRAGASPPSVLTWSLRVRDSPGAMERVLSVLRRRLVPVEGLSLARGPGDTLELEMQVSVEADRRERVAAELAGLVDVEAWAEANPSTEQPRTEDDAC